MPRILCVFFPISLLNVVLGAETRIHVEPDTVILSYKFELEGFTHHRVDRSVDLRSWETVGSLGVIDGEGEYRVTEAVEENNSAFFKIIGVC